MKCSLTEGTHNAEEVCELVSHVYVSFLQGAGGVNLPKIVLPLNFLVAAGCRENELSEYKMCHRCCC